MSINFSIFMITLGIGFFFIYVLQPKPNIVIRYPTPENLENIIYTDDSGLCYKYEAKEIKN